MQTMKHETPGLPCQRTAISMVRPPSVNNSPVQKKNDFYCIHIVVDNYIVHRTAQVCIVAYNMYLRTM